MKGFLIGVDEAGRGPLAGPVAVGVVALPASFAIKELFPGVADSKMLTSEKREEIYELVLKYSRMGFLRFCVRFAAPKTIDEIGISKAVRRALYSGVRSLAPEPADFAVLLDGSLHAPHEYEQKTIIRGDVTEPIISLASIVAKVRRDNLMREYAKKYPEYSFEVHKGYGTKKHREAIEKYGLSDIHRISFCKGTLMPRLAAKNIKK